MWFPPTCAVCDIILTILGHFLWRRYVLSWVIHKIEGAPETKVPDICTVHLDVRLFYSLKCYLWLRRVNEITKYLAENVMWSTFAGSVYTVTLRFRATGLFVTFLSQQKWAHLWTVTLRSVQSDPYHLRNKLHTNFTIFFCRCNITSSNHKNSSEKLIKNLNFGIFRIKHHI